MGTRALSFPVNKHLLSVFEYLLSRFKHLLSEFDHLLSIFKHLLSEVNHHPLHVNPLKFWRLVFFKMGSSRQDLLFLLKKGPLLLGVIKVAGSSFYSISSLRNEQLPYIKQTKTNQKWLVSYTFALSSSLRKKLFIA